MGLCNVIITLICYKFIIDTLSIFSKKATVFETHITLMIYYFNEIILFNFVAVFV